MSKFYTGNKVGIYNNGELEEGPWFKWLVGQHLPEKVIWEPNGTKQLTYENNSWQSAPYREKIRCKGSSTSISFAVQETKRNPVWLE